MVTMKSLETKRGFEIESEFFYKKQVFVKKMTIFGYLKMDSFFEIEIYLKMFDNEMVY